MWFREVDFPVEIVDAHRAGELVIFVGAGASCSSPSSLPLFGQLASDIAGDAGVMLTAADLAQPDRALGELDDQKMIDVHERAKARIGPSSSQPNALHEAIVDLAIAAPTGTPLPTRLVSTNYDLHLSTVLHARGVVVDEYRAPALPVGSSFTGVVYLHGNLRQEAKALVVTDGDFGRAYLTEAWAARFLERMFATYTVLFVGYSHNDVVMSYLARGLGPTSRRFALTDDPDGAQWRRLRIQPVSYPNADGTHQALVDAVAAWAEQAGRGLLEHQQQVARLVALPPSHVPEDVSYLEDIVAAEDKVRFFVEQAHGKEWLAWISTQAEFQRLFQPTNEATACTRPLGYWFAEQLVRDEDLSNYALTVLRDAGGRLHSEAWGAIAHQLHMRQTARTPWLNKWLVVLIETAPEYTNSWLDYALAASTWPDDQEVATLLLDFLLEPHAVLEKSYGPDTQARFGVHVRGKAHFLRQSWEQFFRPNLTEIVDTTIVIADRHLRRAHQLFAATGTASLKWDPMSFGRSAIEPHEQDKNNEPIDMLVDVARDSLQVLLDGAPDRGALYLQEWAGSDIPILQRLAVHGWTHRKDVDSSGKLAWLHDKGWLFAAHLRHEVFRLIAASVADADAKTTETLIADARRGPDDEDHGNYESFNALAWIARQAPDLPAAQDAYSEIARAHPDFLERPHPDLTHWMEVGWVQPKPPMTVEALHSLIVDNASAALSALLSYQDVQAPSEGPSWEDATRLLADTVRGHPEDGHLVLEADDSVHTDLSQAVIAGWAQAELSDEAALLVLERISQLDLATVADDVSRLLADGGQRESAPTVWHRFAEARQLAVAAWRELPPGDVDDYDDALVRAINHPAGRLAEFWLHAVAEDWRGDEGNWAGLSEPLRRDLDELLCGGGERQAMAEVVFASQVHFWFGADETWCRQQVLPLLAWDDERRARRTWDGFLTWGRFNDRLLTAGLLEHYLATALHLGAFADTLRRQYSQHIAAIALYSDINPTEWIRSFTTTAEPDVRVMWLEQISWLLSDTPADQIEAQWRRWMREYWAGRIAGVPRPLAVDEASAMAEWVVHLTDSLEDGVSLATSTSGGLRGHSNLLHDLSEDKVAGNADAYARLLAHLLEGTEGPFYDCQDLQKIVSILKGRSGNESIKRMLEQAVRLGCSGAAAW